VEVGGADPSDGIAGEGPGAAGVVAALEGVKGDAEMAVGVADGQQRADGANLDAHLLAEFTAKGVREGFSGADLSAGQFPQAAEQPPFGPAVDQNPTRFPHGRGDDGVVGQGLGGSSSGQGLLPTGRLRPALPPQRAAGAVRPAGRADRRAEVHHRLVELTGLVGGD